MNDAPVRDAAERADVEPVAAHDVQDRVVLNIAAFPDHNRTDIAAPYQMLAPRPMWMSPTSVAVGAIHASGWMTGRLPSNSKLNTSLHSTSEESEAVLAVDEPGKPGRRVRQIAYAGAVFFRQSLP